MVQDIDLSNSAKSVKKALYYNNVYLYIAVSVNYWCAVYAKLEKPIFIKLNKTNFSFI